jgi:hypothetical protein
VTALSADMISEKAIRNENDLQSAVPGLVIKQSGSQNAFNYVIRGQTIDTYTNSPPGVLPYINEAQVVVLFGVDILRSGGDPGVERSAGTLFGVTLRRRCALSDGQQRISLKDTSKAGTEGSTPTRLTVPSTCRFPTRSNCASRAVRRRQRLH